MSWAPHAVRTAALGMLLATAGVLVAAAPAHACKCVNTTTAEDAAAADAVFSGTVRETRKPEPDQSGRVKGLVTYLVDVDRVYKEEGTVVTDTVQVSSQQASASCGLGNLPPGTEYLFFATARDAGFRAGSCGGSRPATDDAVADVEAVLGTGRQMVPDGAKPELVLTEVETAAPQTVGRLAAPGVAIALLGLLGLVFVRVAGSRRS